MSTFSRAGNHLMRHLAYLPGWHTQRRILIIESDDWGSVRTSDKRSLEILARRFPDSVGDPYNQVDALEGDADLEALFDTLDGVRDVQGRPALVTANSVVANPDFKRIKEAQFTRYFHEPVSATRERYPGRTRVTEIIRQGMDAGLYRPQLHGREHLNIARWLKGLSSGTPELLAAFECGMFGVTITSRRTGRGNVMAALDFDSISELRNHREILCEAQHMFKNQYGYLSSSFIPPSYVWHKAHHPVFSSMGIKYLQGLAFRFSPGKPGQDLHRTFRYLGMGKPRQLIHLVRNAFFEPSLRPDADEADRCLKRIAEVFRFGRPAIVGSHRLNFMGSIDESNRRRGLAQLEKLLRAVLKRWPSVEFMSSDQLGDLISGR